MSPIDVFNYLWNDEIIDHIVIETNRYHSSKFGKQLSVTNHEIRQFFGIMILSGYVTMPHRRQFWSNSPTTRNTSVVESGMKSKRFADIMASLHFADNSQIDQNDRIFKIRPIFDHFNKVFATLGKPYPDIWAIDEAMEPYFGRHGLKQFIRGKPVRFGFKLWCLCSKEGLLLKFKLYEGKDSGRVENLTVGENVVCELVFGLLKPVGGPSRHVPRPISSSGRYDGLNHDIKYGPTQRRCGVCKKNVRPMCTKCDVALHVECWIKIQIIERLHHLMHNKFLSFLSLFVLFHN